jgi:UDP-N-acetylglucosamine acyltransferase
MSVGGIDPTARVAEGARIGADVEIGPYCIVGPNVVLDEGCRLLASVHVTGHTRIGARTVVHPFASLGTPPQSVHYRGGATRLAIGADCIIREHVTINTGTDEGGMETRVGDRCFLMTAAHVGHDCRVGNEVTLVNHVGLAGHCEVGDFATIGGHSAVHQHVRVGPYCFVGGLTGLTKDLLPYCAAFETPAIFRGLNAVGLKRRGFSRAQLQTIRAAVRRLVAERGSMRERAERLGAAFPGDADVARIVDFVRAGAKRPFLIPGEEESERAEEDAD